MQPQKVIFLVAVYQTILAILLDVSIRLLIVFRTDDISCRVLPVLDYSRSVNDHEVDILSGRSFCEAAGLLTMPT